MCAGKVLFSMTINGGAGPGNQESGCYCKEAKELAGRHGKNTINCRPLKDGVISDSMRLPI